MEIFKSSRHAKISGDFAESLVLYWLSKYGFECAKVDHTGIDLIAKNPHTNELMGISVKCRSRKAGTEKESVTIRQGDFPKVEAACKGFECHPYFAIVVDAGDSIRAFILSMTNLLGLFPLNPNCNFGMSPKHLEKYAAHQAIKSFEFSSITRCWWP